MTTMAGSHNYRWLPITFYQQFRDLERASERGVGRDPSPVMGGQLLSPLAERIR
jgi:hypothetical protein